MSDIYVAPSGESHLDQPHALTGYARRGVAGRASAPSWSPDGTEIAFTYADPNLLTSIYKMDADGSGETPLTHHQHTHNQHTETSDASVAFDPEITDLTDEQSSPTWSPDGDQIAYVRLVPFCAGPLVDCSLVSDYENRPEVYKMNSDGSNPTLVREFGNNSAVWGG
jgi:Tol biopolymer transport system component